MFSFISPIMSANLQQSGRASANAAGRDADAQSTLEMCRESNGYPEDCKAADLVNV